MLHSVVSYRNSTSNHNSRAAGTISAGLYLIEILHQTTTQAALLSPLVLLYLIEILHQTTTYNPYVASWSRCILSKFYIKPQHPRLFKLSRPCCILSKFYIKPQHFDFEKRINYVVSYRNSTSNHNNATMSGGSAGLYLIEILHQTTTTQLGKGSSCCCILSKFYIKPQHLSFAWRRFCVVSYRNSTSNHNNWRRRTLPTLLYLIEILHQTTTFLWLGLVGYCCILSKFYIKPQLYNLYGDIGIGCILSKFYIKPQLATHGKHKIEVVSYRNSTSNHNLARSFITGSLVVSYRNSTSNHNSARPASAPPVLYLIEILHQTTTRPMST